jgi:hypothetical protein
MSVPLPASVDGDDAGAGGDQPKSKLSRGAMSKSFATRPVYCEIPVTRIEGELGFTLNTAGVEPIIVITAGSKLAAKVKAGDVVTAIEGDACDCNTAAAMLAAQPDRFDLDVIRYVEGGGGGGGGAGMLPPSTGDAIKLAAELEGAMLLGMKRQAEALVDLEEGWTVKLAGSGSEIVYTNPGTGVTQAHRPGTTPDSGNGNNSSGAAGRATTPVLSLDCEFKGAATGDQKDGQAGKSLSKAVKKQAKAEAKLARKQSKEDMTVSLSELPGMIRLSFDSTRSIFANRIPKVPKRLLSMQIAGEVVFEIGMTDIFTVVTRKKKLLFMVQPPPPTPTKCYIVKCGSDADCKDAAAAATSLPGHVDMPAAPTKPPRKSNKLAGLFKKKESPNKEKKLKLTKEEKAAEKQVREKEKKEKKERERQVKKDKKGGKGSASADGAAAAPGDISATIATTVDGGAAAATSTEQPKAPRRKLVRGANARVVAVLPEFQAAIDALDELDKYLDQVTSTDSYLAAASAEVSRSNISKAKSRKWMREASRKVARGLPENPDGSDAEDGSESDEDGDEDGDGDGDGGKLTRSDMNGSLTSLNSMSSMLSMASSYASDGEDDDNAAIFLMLEEKRKEREAGLVERQKELAVQSAQIHAEQEAFRKVEMERIVKMQAKEQEEVLADKEYCHVGAQRRMKQLSFKFRWGATDRKSGSEF